MRSPKQYPVHPLHTSTHLTNAESCSALKRFAASIAAISIVITPAASFANPVGGTVVAGQANIIDAGKTLDVNQISNKAVIDWRGFDIAPDETTRFNQPNSNSLTVNRVNSNAPSVINGKLTANGNLVVINQNGVLFGDKAKVDVNGIVATTADADNASLMKDGKLVLSKPGNPNAAIVNQGSITAKEAGLVGFVAPNVANSGVIEAKLGRVHLASGDTATVDLYGDSLMEVAVSDKVTSQLVQNSGLIEADGGKIALTAAAGKDIVNSLIDASGIMKAQSVKQKNGEIIISAEGSNAVKGNASKDKGKKSGTSNVIVSGMLDVSGRKSGERGGKVTVTGDNVALLNGSIIDASGHTGKSGTTNGKLISDARDGSAGGVIKIGGDYLGQSETPTAKNLYVDAGAYILNDSIDTGDAGRSIFWSDGTTQFYGNVFARALGGKPVDASTLQATLGGNIGDGGFVETSGHGHLDAGGYVDLTASNGKRGTYFLDPADITIYGNVDPAFVSSDGTTINLAPSLKLWLDASDTSKVNLTYNALGTTATGTSGTNTITVSANTGLTVGARIRLGAAGAVNAANTLGADTYTITGIAGTTITLSSNLTTSYAASGVFQGYVSQLTDKSGQGSNATQGTAANMPLWISNGLNGLGLVQYSNVPITTLSLTGNFNTTAGGYNTIATIMNWSGGDSQMPFGFTFYDIYFYGGAIGFNTGNSELYGISSVGFANTWKQLTAVFYNGNTDNSQLFINSTPQALSCLLGTCGNSRSVTGGGFSISSWVTDTGYGLDGRLSEIIAYNSSLSTNARNLVDQYQSAKWGIALDPVAGAGTEIAEATGAMGYSVFTARYLERLSQTADISLQATNNITLDMGGDSLAMTGNRNLTLTAGNDILTASAGTIQATTDGVTANTGNILLSAGRDINLTHDVDFVTTGAGNNADRGTVTLRANNSIFDYGSGDITTQAGGVTLNSDRDASGAGTIALSTGTNLTSNGGNITLGGGATPATVAAIGTAANVYGVVVSGTTINTGAGNILVNGTGYSNAGTGYLNGVFIIGSAVLQSTSGNITVNGIGGNGTLWNTGIQVDGVNTTLTTATGAISLNGTGGAGSGAGYGYGILLTSGSSILSTGTGAGAGTITLQGQGGSVGAQATGIGVYGTNISSVDGAVNLTGTGGTGGGHGIYFYTNNNITSTGYAPITLTGIENVGYTALSLSSYAGFTDVIGGASATGPITLSADIFDTTLLGSLNIQTTGSVNIVPRTANTSVGIAGAAGTLRVVNGIINTITAGQLNIGRLDGTGLFSVAANTWNNPTSLITGSGGITVTGAQNAGANAFSITADTINLGANLTGTGTLTLQPASNAQAVNVNNGVAGFALDTAEIGRIVDGWSQINIGRTTGLNDLIVGTSTWSDPITFRNNFRQINSSTLTTTNNASITFQGGWLDAYGTINSAGPVTFNTANFFSYGNSVNVINNNITFNTLVNLQGGGFLTLSAGSGTINFVNDIDDDGVGMAQALTANAGSIVFGNRAGNFNPLGNVSLTSTNSLTLPSINAATILARTTGASADITIPVGTTLTASGAGNALTLAAGNRFLNNAGLTAFNLTGGSSARWLVYSADASTDLPNGLRSDFLRYGTSYSSYLPASVVEAGNGFLFVNNPGASSGGGGGTSGGGTSVPVLDTTGPNPAITSIPVAPVTPVTPPPQVVEVPTPLLPINPRIQTVSVIPSTVEIMSQTPWANLPAGSGNGFFALASLEPFSSTAFGTEFAQPMQLASIGNVTKEDRSGESDSDEQDSDEVSTRQAQAAEGSKASSHKMLEIDAALAKQLGLTKGQFEF